MCYGSLVPLFFLKKRDWFKPLTHLSNMMKNFFVLRQFSPAFFPKKNGTGLSLSPISPITVSATKVEKQAVSAK
jgi:hypothetical protein